MNKETIISVARALATHLPADEAFKAFCGVLREELLVDRASLAMYDEMRDDFVVDLLRFHEHLGEFRFDQAGGDGVDANAFGP